MVAVEAPTNLDHLPEPPQVSGAPLVGNTLEMAKSPADMFVKYYKEHGPAYRINVLGRDQVVLAGPQAALFMNSREGRECLRSKEFWEGLVEEYGATRTLTGIDGEPHQELRGIMRRGYSRAALNGQYDKVVELVDGVLERDWKPGTKVSVVEAMQFMVVDVLGVILTGEAPYEYVKDIRTSILNILNVLVTRQRPGFMLKMPSYKKAKARVHELGEKMIKDWHEKGQYKPEEERNLIDDIMICNRDRPDIIPDQDLILTLTGPYVAGLDTVANTTAAMVYAVLKTPGLLERIREEVDPIFESGEPIDENTLRNMPVMHGVVMETLRFYTIAVAQMRTATKDFEFEGYRIKEGEMLYVATVVPHFMDEFFPEPYKFDIERYERPRLEHTQPGAFSPFGRGAHTCLGQSMADVLLMLIMARFFYKIDTSLPSKNYVLKTKTAPTPGPSMKFKVGVDSVRK
ncbi:MAG: cytochrome P450 [Alphaproteobacteria bacterium]